MASSGEEANEVQKLGWIGLVQCFLHETTVICLAFGGVRSFSGPPQSQQKEAPTEEGCRVTLPEKATQLVPPVEHVFDKADESIG